MLKRTALFSAHQKLGAKLIDFGGWEMPVQYTSITDEHLAVRNAAGIFDISHMGEVTVSGAAAEEFLNHVLTNDIRKLTPGLGQYTLQTFRKCFFSRHQRLAHRGRCCVAGRAGREISGSRRIAADRCLAQLRRRRRARPAREGIHQHRDSGRVKLGHARRLRD